METKVFYQVNKIFTLINSESKIATFEKEEDAFNYARLSKMNEPRYDYKVYKVMYSEEAIDTIEPNEPNEQE